MQQQRQHFERIIRSDPDLMRLLGAVRALNLPQWRLVAGCLYQTVWNVLTGRPRGTGIKDYGLADMFAMVIRPNPVMDNRASHEAKAARVEAIWPEVTIIPWDHGGG